MRLVFLGPPGAGKGTQAKLLADARGLLHLSTGDTLRDAVKRGTRTGLEAKGFMDRGQLVPDRVVDALVAERLAEPDARRGYILDGYPRNLAQAAALDGVPQASPLGGVLYLKVGDDVLVKRLLGRGQGRADDTEEVIRERLTVYREQTAPLVEHYDDQGLLAEIDGEGTVDEVRAAVDTAASRIEEAGA